MWTTRGSALSPRILFHGLDHLFASPRLLARLQQLQAARDGSKQHRGDGQDGDYIQLGPIRPLRRLILLLFSTARASREIDLVVDQSCMLQSDCMSNESEAQLAPFC